MSETILGLAAQIVSDFVGNNVVRADQVPTLIREVHRTLATVGEASAEPAKAEPAVEVKKSVFADHLVCLGCGKSFKMLKWHLMSDHQLTPDAYRAKFGLPHGYPLVASAYSKVRSAISTKFGLGHWRTQKKARRKRG
jgi:predicted transcriptional regulator